MQDLCVFQPNWHARSHYDALKQPWPTCLNYVNPPFSRALEFLAYGLWQWLEGVNSVLLVPWETT